MDPMKNNASNEPTDEPMIPKHRFNEINGLYKQERKKVRSLEETNKNQEAQIEMLCTQIEEIKSGYEKAADILRIKEIFVSGGLTEREYQDLVNIISSGSKPDMIELASCITSLINKK